MIVKERDWLAIKAAGIVRYSLKWKNKAVAFGKTWFWLPKYLVSAQGQQLGTMSALEDVWEVQGIEVNIF